MSQERQDVVGVHCVKNWNGNIMVESDKIKNAWKHYMEKLLNEENEWDNDVVCEGWKGLAEG